MVMGWMNVWFDVLMCACVMSVCDKCACVMSV